MCDRASLEELNKISEKLTCQADQLNYGLKNLDEANFDTHEFDEETEFLVKMGEQARNLARDFQALLINIDAMGIADNRIRG